MRSDNNARRDFVNSRNYLRFDFLYFEGQDGRNGRILQAIKDNVHLQLGRNFWKGILHDLKCIL